MWCMEKLRFTRPKQVRAHNPVYKRFVARVADLGTRSIRFEGAKEPKIESVTNAFWLWFAEIDTASAEQWLRDHYPPLEAFMRAHPDVTPARDAQGRATTGLDIKDVLPDDEERRDAGGT